MDSSEHKHLDAAEEQWAREDSRSRNWSMVLRLMPYCVVGAMLVAVFRIFK